MSSLFIRLFLEHLLQSKSSLRSELIHFLSDFLSLLSNDYTLNRKNSLNLALDTFINSLSRVSKSAESSLIDFLSTSWEDNEFLDILLKSLDVSLERLVGLISSSGVDGDTNRSGVLLVDSDGLDLFKSEPSSFSHLTRVSLSWLVDQGSEFRQRSWE